MRGPWSGGRFYGLPVTWVICKTGVVATVRVAETASVVAGDSCLLLFGLYWIPGCLIDS